MSKIEQAVIALNGKLDPITKSIGFRQGRGFKDGFIEFATSGRVDKGFEWICDREEFEAVARKMLVNSASPNWNGQGLPPVGTVCEAQHKVLSWREPERGKILFMGDEIYVIKTDDGEKARLIDGARFYPIKSDRDKWIDECVKILSNEHARVTDVVKNLCMFKGEASAIYDALKSSKLPTP